MVNNPKVRIYARSVLPQTVEEIKKFLVLKQDVFIDGEFLDTYFYSILKENWMKS